MDGRVASTMEPDHIFSLDPYLKRSTNWYAWQCSCGAQSPGHYRWKAKARLAWYRTHVYPGAAATEPTHRITVTGPNEFNTWEWTCSCGDAGRPHGYVNEQRCWQSHGSHAVQSSLLWYRHLDDRMAALAERAAAERERWARLTPEGRQRLAARDLEELL